MSRVRGPLDGGQPQLAAFVGLINAAWNLPEGEYQIRAVSQDGQIFLPAESQLSDGSLDWPAELQLADPAEDAQQAAAIRTLVAFLVQAEEAKLTALENSSDGFSALLFSTDPSQLELDELYDRYAAIGAQEAAVLDALELVFGSRLSEGRAPKVAAPARGLKDTLLGFFGYAGAAGERARDRILSDLQPVRSWAAWRGRSTTMQEGCALTLTTHPRPGITCRWRMSQLSGPT